MPTEENEDDEEDLGRSTKHLPASFCLDDRNKIKTGRLEVGTL